MAASVVNLPGMTLQPLYLRITNLSINTRVLIIGNYIRGGGGGGGGGGGYNRESDTFIYPQKIKKIP